MRAKLLSFLPLPITSTDNWELDHAVDFIYDRYDLNGFGFNEYDELIEKTAQRYSATFLTRECSDQNHVMPDETWAALQLKYPHVPKAVYHSGWCKYFLRNGVDTHNG